MTQTIVDITRRIATVTLTGPEACVSSAIGSSLTVASAGGDGAPWERSISIWRRAVLSQLPRSKSTRRSLAHVGSSVPVASIAPRDVDDSCALSRPLPAMYFAIASARD